MLLYSNLLPSLLLERIRMQRTFLKKAVSLLAVVALLLNNILIAVPVVYAQEATPTSETQATWINNNNEYTIETIKRDVSYKFPPNEKVSLTFTKLPEDSGTVTIKEVNALGTTAYDITSTMTDGAFEYILTLPTSTTENVEVKASEDGQTFVTVGGVTAQTDTLTITGLNHFTIFVVVGTISGSSSTAFDESNSNVVINEFMFDPEDGNDWVELYNRGSETADLANWKLKDNTSAIATLTGFLLPGGFVAFDVSRRLNAAFPNGDRITLINAQDIDVSQVAYKDSANINGAQNIGEVDEEQSVGRETDGAGTWQAFDNPTKGFNNSGNPTFITVGEIYEYTSIKNAIDDLKEGGTIHVTRGEYEENLEINKSLTLLGDAGDESAGPGDNAPTIVGGCSGDPVISIEANDVTVSGFNVIEGGCDSSGIYVDGSTNGATISDNDINEASYYGVELDSGSSNHQILRNLIHDNGDAGIYNGQSATGNQAHQNVISGNIVGVQNNDDGNTFDATANFWGSILGPLHQLLNPTGTGDRVSNNVLFRPWYLTNALTNLDSTIPTITLSSTAPNATNSTIPVTATFSESVVGFEEGDVNVGNGTLSNFNAVSGTVYIFNITPSTNGAVTVNVVSQAAQDASGNFNLAATQLSRIYDNISPAAALIIIPLLNTTSIPEAIVSATTIEALTCKYSLDGGANTAMDATGGILHTKIFSALAVGSHNIRLTCTDSAGNSTQSLLRIWNVGQSSGNSLISSGTSPNFASTTAGQAELPFGITTLTLSNNTNLDVSSGLNTALGNNITLGGLVKDLANFTSGNLTGQNLSGTQSIGGVSFEIQKAVTLQSGVNAQPILLTNLDLSGVNVSIPDGAAVLAPNGWSGTIQPPKTGSSSGTVPSGFSIGSTVIEVGSSDVVLLFDNPAEVILSGVTGPVGYKSARSTTWIQITNTCGGTYTSPTSPTFPGECAISDGTNTKIITYHFTSFASLNTVSSTSSSSSSSSSSSGGGDGVPTSPVCNDAKPGSAPVLSVSTTGTNEVTLTWSKAKDPVTYYLITYGMSPGQKQYGNPNVGNVTTYTVSGLSGGTTYYFKVRAGNGCRPGDYSNEVSARVGGATLIGSAAGFEAGVLSTQTKDKEEIPSPTSGETPRVPVSIPVEQKNIFGAVGKFFGAILGFFRNLFR